MTCIKCNYQDKKEKESYGKKLCSICQHFAPQDKQDFDNYVNEKIDWKLLDTFRKYNQEAGEKQKKGMQEKANQGKPMTRPPWGYDLVEGELVQNQDAAKVHSLFKMFLEKDISLNSLAKQFGLSVNGLKKVLSNRTYLGEVKFAGKITKGEHKPLISPEIFYAVQRRLGGVCLGAN